jgi:hypothetical protein
LSACATARAAALALAVALTLVVRAAPTLLVTATADGVHVRASELRFLQGRILDRLHDGGAARITLRLELLPQRNALPLAQAEQTFVVSFDLWEERFAVTRLGQPARTASHLTSTAAEAWCVDNVTVPLSALAADRPARVWARLVGNARTEPAVREPADEALMRRLIDAFSRRTTDEEPPWILEGGPFRLTS